MRECRTNERIEGITNYLISVYEYDQDNDSNECKDEAQPLEDISTSLYHLDMSVQEIWLVRILSEEIEEPVFIITEEIPSVKFVLKHESFILICLSFAE